MKTNQTEQGQATARPWKSSFATVRQETGPCIICDCDTLSSLNEGAANAALIVRAVNLIEGYEALEKAAREMADAAFCMDTSYGTSDFLPGEKQRRYQAALENLDAACIKLAELKGGAK